jgi:hypothetical protein
MNEIEEIMSKANWRLFKKDISTCEQCGHKSGYAHCDEENKEIPSDKEFRLGGWFLAIPDWCPLKKIKCPMVLDKSKSENGKDTKEKTSG